MQEEEKSAVRPALMSSTPRPRPPLVPRLAVVMALAAVDPFYRAREEPLVRAEHAPHNLARYLDALERMVRDEQAHMASARSPDPACLTT